MADVVVIGAGMGGLAAAIDLAVAGERVTVLEAAHGPGGKVGIASFDGVEFDTGPSVLTMPEVVRDLLADAGATLDDELELLQHDRPFEYLWPDGARLDVHFEPQATLQSVADTFGAAARDELANFLRYAEGIWSHAAPAFVYGDAPTLGSTLQMGMRALSALRKIDPMRTMRTAIESQVREPHLRDILTRYATYNGSDPRVAPATLNCIAHVELTRGSYGIRGGMVELARLLERVARHHGVEFRYDEPVRRIDVSHDRVTGVTTDSGHYAASAVVANADVAHVFADLLPAGPHTNLPPSMSGWTAVIRARRTTRAPHTVLFPTNYAHEFADIFDHRRPPTEPTVYLCAQAAAHHRPGWPDHEPLFVMANAPAEPPDHATPPETFTHLEQTVLTRLRAFDLVADDDPIIWRRTPPQLAAQFPGSRGAIYGAASNSRFSAFQRPANRCTAPHGLFLASGSAHPGGGIPLCLLSGRAAAREVLRHKKSSPVFLPL